MPENGANARIGFTCEEIEPCRHGVAHGFPARWHVALRAQIHRILAVAYKRSRWNEACTHAGLKQFAVPVLVGGGDHIYNQIAPYLYKPTLLIH